jgi:hypothetical protein
MMTSKLAELFQASNGAPIEWQGKTVRMMYEVLGLHAGQVIQITFEKVSSARPQAVRLKARGGRLEVNGQVLDDIAIWSDSATNPVRLVVRPATDSNPISVRVWNAWRDSAGTMQAWIGNSGIVVEEGGKAVVLHCSDGFDEPVFDDLVAQFEILPVA